MKVGSDLAHHSFVRRLNEADVGEDETVEILLAEVAERFHGAAALFSPGTGEHLQLASVRHRRAEHLEEARAMVQHLRRGASSLTDFVQTVFRSGEPFLAPERRTGPALIAVPLVAHDDTFGVLAIVRDREAGPFDGADLSTAEALADEAAMALRGARLIEECRSSTRELDEARGTLQAILDSAGDAILVLDADGVVQSANAAMVRLVGCDSAALCGTRVDEFVTLDIDDGRETVPVLLAGYDAHGGLREIRMRRADGRTVTVEMSINRVRGTERHLYVAVARDVSERKRSEEVLRREASADPLTGLVNRTSLHHALGRSMRRVDEGRQLALLFIDLDGFKQVNDHHGHQAGDDVLRAVARRITRSVRSGDLVARYGGDEFVVVLEADEDIEHEAELVRSRIAASFAEPFAVGGGTHLLGASIGQSVHGVDGTTISQLVAQADRAMYREKHAHRNR